MRKNHKAWNLGKNGLSLCVITILLILFVGCGNRIDYSLPHNPIRFETGTFVNPNDSEDTYLSISYHGRTYILYGTLNSTVTGKNIGNCLGFIVQEGVEMEESRVFLLNEDPDANYLCTLETEGIMNQPFFYRAINTVGKEIFTPEYITDLEYDFWMGGEHTQS